MDTVTVSMTDTKYWFTGIFCAVSAPLEAKEWGGEVPRRDRNAGGWGEGRVEGGVERGEVRGGWWERS